MRIFVIFVSLLLAGCLHRPTTVSVQPSGGVVMSHDPDVKSPPSVTTTNDDVVIPVPGGAKIFVSEFNHDATQTEAKRTTIEFPKETGSEIRVKRTEINASGSAGHQPATPPTPFEKSISYWSYAGIGLFLLGVFFITPWGGSNYRVGALICAGGLTMSLLGTFLNEMSQWFKYNMPGWLPAVGFLGIAAAIFLYWGYRHRHSQIATEDATTKASSQ